ncbi:CD74 molecule, major histocompatibility complex, class II invariant chain a isoform X2 [Myripristis murdjan]|uniref:CD74 molecule, major histocompatibility complex, class II invariant chain a isoform X2 n=1 Tax=Myripristis murdjan TaxID=586833 RepID=UPI001175E2EC|nr:HLA class II histocompatibility antigen gamma chain isoform X2 [Myripristis murdjan]
MDHNQDDAPLAGSRAGSEEALVTHATPGGGSNSRALKVAGLTTLAVLLLASQVFTAYTVFNQKSEIHKLQKNSDNMRRDIARKVQVAPMQMHMPMSNLPLLTDFDSDDDSKTSETSLAQQDTATVDVEKEVKDLLQNSPLPHFNETFLANLQGLQKQMNESEWQSFETWMRYWLIFQMAQEKPPAPTPAVTMTKCQMEAAAIQGVKPGFFKPQCDEQGRYKPMQCWHSTGFCWCVDKNGNPIEGTSMRGRPQCTGQVPRRMMAAPRMMQLKSYSKDDEN